MDLELLKVKLIYHTATDEDFDKITKTAKDVDAIFDDFKLSESCSKADDLSQKANDNSKRLSLSKK